MAIQRNNNTGSGGRIDKPGDYAVTVEKTETGKSKSGKSMLTVTFITDDEKRIRGYYCKGVDFHMKALSDLKIALGLKADSPAENMIDKRCGIAVDEQAPGEDGKVWMTISGYGKESEVDGHTPPKEEEETIPF